MGADQCATGQHGASCIDLGRVRVCRALFAVLSLPGFLGPRQPRMDAVCRFTFFWCALRLSRACQFSIEEQLALGPIEGRAKWLQATAHFF